MIRKGMFSLFGALAFASAGISFGAAPVMSDIPEVIIGDIPAEPPHTDSNFFVFTDAFKFDDYVSDADTPDASLLWSFAEGDDPVGPPTQWFEINFKGPINVGTINYDPNDHLAPGASELRSVSQFATFRDIVLSPTSGFPPFSPSVPDLAEHGTGKVVTFYVSDGTTVTSQNTIVYSIDGTTDTLSPASPFVLYQDDPFPTDSTNVNWVKFGSTLTDTTLTTSDYDAGVGAYRVRVFSHASKFRLSGWNNQRANWMPYPGLVGTANYARAKYFMYSIADGWTSAALECPAFELGLSQRFGYTAQYYVNPGVTAGSGLYPSTNPSSPSAYRVDFDPLDITFMNTSTSTLGPEGVQSRFDLFELDALPRGTIGMTERLIGYYPASYLDSNVLRTRIWNGTTSSQGGALALFVSSDMINSNLDPASGPAAGDKLTASAGTSTFVGSAAGVRYNSSAVPSNRIGRLFHDYHPEGPEGGTQTFFPRLRMNEDEIYKVRFHITSTVTTALQSSFWLKVRSAGFAFNPHLQFGPGSISGNNGQIMKEGTPGVGTQVTSGNYDLIFSSIMDKGIRPEFPTLAQGMPFLATQPGEGIGASSNRDIRPAFELWDAIGLTPGTEFCDILIDNVTITVHPQFEE